MPSDEVAHWSYSGDDGPEQWGDLSPDFLMCKQGKEQIDRFHSSMGFDTKRPIQLHNYLKAMEYGLVISNLCGCDNYPDTGGPV